MRSLLKNSLVIVLILSAMGCRKDTPVVEQPADTDTLCQQELCYDLPPEPDIGYQYTNEGPQYVMPCFNPLNSDEFVYIRKNGGINTELVKYSISAKQETVLCNSLVIFEQPQWGKSGWITFSSGKKVWKLYQDGSQLTQLTFDMDDNVPYFSFEGDRIIYRRLHHYTNWTYQQNPELYKEDKMMVIDLDGNVLDSIMVERIGSESVEIFYYQTWGVAAFDLDAIYFYGGKAEYDIYGIFKLNFQDSLITPVLMLGYPENANWMLDLDQSGNYIYYTQQRDGLYKFDIQSGTNAKIRFGCGTRYYDHISVSEDGKKLLVEKINMEAINCCEVDEQREIWLLDLEDGCEMVQILGE